MPVFEGHNHDVMMNTEKLFRFFLWLRIQKEGQRPMTYQLIFTSLTVIIITADKQIYPCCFIENQ